MRLAVMGNPLCAKPTAAELPVGRLGLSVAYKRSSAGPVGTLHEEVGEPEPRGPRKLVMLHARRPPSGENTAGMDAVPALRDRTVPSGRTVQTSADPLPLAVNRTLSGRPSGHQVGDDMTPSAEPTQRGVSNGSRSSMHTWVRVSYAIRPMFDQVGLPARFAIKGSSQRGSSGPPRRLRSTARRRSPCRWVTSAVAETDGHRRLQQPLEPAPVGLQVLDR